MTALNDSPDGETVSPQDIAAFCHQLADAARPIAQRHFRSAIGFERKTDLTPVTIADQSIEAELRRRISDRFPGHGIVGEELAATAGGRYTWYLDPIDGTKSFISGMPLFGTLIAVHDSVAGRVAAGVIDMPALDERWFGGPGGTTFNGAPARVSGTKRLADAQIYTSSPDFFTPEAWARYENLSRRAMFRRFGGDCYLYGLLASGHCDLVVEMSLKVFDFMALVPVVEGAGGFVRDWNGRELTPASDGKVVAAASKELLGEALAALNA